MDLISTFLNHAIYIYIYYLRFKRYAFIWFYLMPEVRGGLRWWYNIIIIYIYIHLFSDWVLPKKLPIIASPRGRGLKFDCPQGKKSQSGNAKKDRAQMNERNGKTRTIMKCFLRHRLSDAFFVFVVLKELQREFEPWHWSLVAWEVIFVRKGCPCVAHVRTCRMAHFNNIH
jgi:hypothetical protein